MRRRSWKLALRDPAVARPLIVVAVLLLGFALPKACDSGKNTYRQYQVAQWHDRIDRHAAASGLDPALVRSVILAESSGNPHAHSNANAKGLMQITPITHTEAQQRFGLPNGDLFDPEHNLTVGTTYLAYLFQRFDNDPALALAAYHMGPTRVARLRRQHPDLNPTQLIQQHAGPQTRAYLKRVLGELSE